MDERIKRRIFLFYGFGIFNAFLGIYVLVEGAALLGAETATWAVVLCLGFAAANFYMAHALKKKVQEFEAQRAAAERRGSRKSGAPT